MTAGSGPAEFPGDVVGEPVVLATADEMRQVGAVSPMRLYNACVEQCEQGHVEFDGLTVLYRHAMIHAGAIVPCDRPRFDVCPMCGARLYEAGD